LHLQNEFDEAIPPFQKAIALDPSLWGSNLMLGIDFFKTNQFPKAIEPLEKALKLNPELAGAEGYFWLGVTYMALQQYHKAIPELERRRDQTPHDIEVLYNLGTAYQLFSVQLDNKLSFLINERTLPSDLASPAYATLTQSHLQQLREQMEMRLGKSDQDADALKTLIGIFREMSSRTLQQIAEIDPNSYRVHMMKGESYEKQEQYSKASEEYKAAYASKPDVPGIRFAIGSCYWKSRQFDEASQWLQEELKRNPHHAIASYQLGNIYVYRNKPLLAVPLLEQALAVQPQLGDARRDLGKAHVQLGQYERAIAEFKRVAELEPEDDTIHSLLANAYRKQGNAEFEKAELELFRRLNQAKLERAQQRRTQQAK
jgi:tetratricopeptide (TPR) repeat protein